MPELPEVEAIAAVVARHAVGRSITRIRVLRGPRYFASQQLLSARMRALDPSSARPAIPYDTHEVLPTACCVGMRLGVTSVSRVGKHVVIGTRNRHLLAHNAMTGYFDWAHEPWTFDYVEGPRESTDRDVRALIDFDDSLVLRFHDARLFGRLEWSDSLPTVGPELLATPMGAPGRPVIDLPGFAAWVLSERRPVKEALMDQARLAGVGNIYANEACHLAGVDPRWPGRSVPPANVPLLLEALRCVVERCMPEVTYQWLKVYRRSRCGTCDGPVLRVELSGRATFFCEECQA